MPITIETRALKEFIAGVLIGMGVATEDAPSVADAYITADLFGLASHGVMRVLRIEDGIEAGTHFPANRPSIVRESDGTALVNGNSGLGVAVGVFAMRKAIEKARNVGVGCVGVFNSNHFGIAGYYVRLAAAEQMIGFAFCNSAPGISAMGGRRAVLGTNPVAIGAPTRQDPFALDLSPASVVRGKALEAQRKGEQLPEGVAVDSKGSPTTDPSAALEGAFLPYGGPQAYKTFGLALMIDVLCGPLVGAAFGDRVTGSADTTVECNKGDLYIAIDISRFRDYDAFLDDMDELGTMVKGSGENVLLPGEPEHARARQSGGSIVLDDDLVRRLNELGAKYDIQLAVE